VLNPDKKERLTVKLFRVVEGEAEGPFAIAALFTVVIVILWRFL
jgi:hypothetical protein